MAFDTLEISKRLKSAGFAEAQADVLVGVLRDTRDEDISKLATKDELKALENAMNAGFAALRAEMEILRRDITIRLGGMIVVSTGVLLAAKFFG